LSLHIQGWRQKDQLSLFWFPLTETFA
jgi:hypothetical protein